MRNTQRMVQFYFNFKDKNILNWKMFVQLTWSAGMDSHSLVYYYLILYLILLSNAAFH